MEALRTVLHLTAQGRYADALNALDALPAIRSRTIEAEISRIELLERTGRYAESVELSRRLLRSRSITDSQRSVCEFAIGMAAWEAGELGAAIESFQRAVEWADRSQDLRQACWAQLRLFVSLSGQSATIPQPLLFSEMRQNVVRLGDPIVSAAMHIFLGEVEAKRGLVSTSVRHTRIAQSLLAKSGNVWLEALAENNCAAVAIMQFELQSGIAHAQRAIRLSRESGAAAVLRAALANFGNIHSLRGDFATARELLEQSYAVLPGSGEHANGVLDEIARTYLAEGRLEDARVLLDRVQQSRTATTDRALFSSRHALLSRTELLIRQGRWAEARPQIDCVVDVANKVGDRMLQAAGLAREAQIAAAMNRPDLAVTSLNALAALVTHDRSPVHYIRYELAIHSAMVPKEDASASTAHLERAAALCRALGCDRGLLASRWPVSQRSATGASPEQSLQVQNFAALLMHVGRPELLSSGLIAILQEVPCIQGARAVVREADGTEQCIGSCGTMAASAHIRTFCLSESNQRTVVLEVQAPQDVESQATVNSIGFIIAAVQDLERARLEREERQTLWPADELPAENDDSVVAGKMRDIMLYSRKVAQTNVTVLITGESGTGKEVVARAIHRYSPRAKKPFVPFNCTAVPRELLESHLFGFRRGAFTGADRDNPGLIRAAKDGTLFLDEIGELGLDLQPKLLRFLESGEINPLGDTSPFPVNVRIVAATNADLQKLVAEGRFREDLYYRLSVIPISLPPLRDRREEVAPLAQHFALKWSHELGKGRMRVADDLMEHLVLYPWPGNIRQLSNEIHRMVAVADANQPLTLEHLPRALRLETERLKRLANGLELAVPLTDRMDRAVENLEREMIKVALRTNHGKVEATAQALGLSRKGLYLKRQRFGL